MTKRAALVVTGASQGFGACVAVAISQRLDKEGFKTDAVLTARSAAGLAQTAAKLPKTAVTHAVTADLSDASALLTNLDAIFAPLSGEYDRVILVNNAGSLGDVQHLVSQQLDGAAAINEFRGFLELNVTSTLALTCRFLREFDGVQTHVINVSSLLAVQAVGGFATYALAKAGRDLFHATIAKELEGQSDAKVKVLNYAPGPLDNGMSQTLREEVAFEPTRKMFASMHEEGKLVKMEASAQKLVKLLADDTFDSGAHIDFYDLPDEDVAEGTSGVAVA